MFVSWKSSVHSHIAFCFCLTLLVLTPACRPPASLSVADTADVEQATPAAAGDKEPVKEPTDSPAKPVDESPKESTTKAPPTSIEPTDLPPEQPTELDTNPPEAESGETETSTDTADEEPTDPDVAAADQPDLPVDPNWKPLTENGIVWLDVKQKTVIVSGKVCLREGPLEMFACPPHTKEYESLVVVDCPSFLVHGALLAVGAKPGSPVKFNPYVGASGPVIDAFVEWLDDDGNKRRVKVQEWIRHEKTGKPMEHDFVFGGSGFWTDDEGKQSYSADGGELMCVSNFSTATMDLAVASPQDNQGLWFTAFTEKIPKLGTKIHLILIPRAE